MKAGYFRAACAAMLCLLAPMQAHSAEEPAPGTLTVTFEGLRSARGVIRACLTRSAALYLKCDRDPAALKANVSAGKDAKMEFTAVPPGDYVLAVVHDENGNAKVDTLLGIPREGVGFSRNPAMLFGPPKYASARFHVPSGPSAMGVTLKYFL